MMGRWSSVMNIDGLNLVGIDFIVKYGAVIDMQKDICTILGMQVPLISWGGTGSVCRMVVMNNTVIPPRSEMFIPG